MVKEYHVEGMSCQSCKANIENSLQAVSGVSSAVVSFESKSVKVDSKYPLSLDELGESLPSKFQLSEKGESAAKNSPSDLQRLFPLFLIFGYITVAAILLNKSSLNLDSMMIDFMGLFFIVFSFFKFLDIRGFARSFRMYDPLAQVFPSYGLLYPSVELILGLLLLNRIEVSLVAILTIVILGITTVGVLKVLKQKKELQCACLGTGLNLPMTKATFIENVIMIIMSIVLLVHG